MSTKLETWQRGGVLGTDFDDPEVVARREARRQQYRSELAAEKAKATEAATKAIHAEEVQAAMSDALFCLPGFAEFIERDRHAARALNETTRQTYKAEFGMFRRWCETEGIPALPAAPEAVANFIIERTAQEWNSTRVVIAAIGFVHRTFDFPDPTQHVLVLGARWFLGSLKRLDKPKGKKKGRREIKRAKPTTPDATAVTP